MREGGTKTSYKIVHDDVSNAILKQAKTSKTDIIVMGSRRLTGISSIKRLGSTHYMYQNMPSVQLPLYIDLKFNFMKKNFQVMFSIILLPA